MLIPQNRLMLLGHPVAKMLGNIYILHNNSHTIKLISSWYNNITKRVWQSDNLPCPTALCRALCGNKYTQRWLTITTVTSISQELTEWGPSTTLTTSFTWIWLLSESRAIARNESFFFVTEVCFTITSWSRTYTHTQIHTDIVIETRRRYMPLVGGSLTFLLLQHDWLAEVSQSCGYHG